MIMLRGIAWDHPRGVDPLRAAARNPVASGAACVGVTWDVRTLQEFEDAPLEQLSRNYDLIAVDHPLIADSCDHRPALWDLADLVSDAVLHDARSGSVGPSFRSYQWQGHQYALPIDAAAQVAAHRPDLVATPPTTWAQLRQVITQLPAGRHIAIAGSPTHLYLSWLSLCHQYASGPSRPAGGTDHRWWGEDGPRREVGEQALTAIYSLLDICDSDSLALNPIGLLDRMATGDEIAYAPLVFGYANYGRVAAGRHRLAFCDPPSPTGIPSGTVLGGVGIAVSVHSRHPHAAARVVERLVSGAYQRTRYAADGGQPAHADAWRDPAVNGASNGFFTSTRTTLDRSFLRPRCVGYPAFQTAAGALLHDAAMRRRPVAQVVAEISGVWRDLC
jgi:multiple sugar transport system substrate-binding protein